MKNNISNETLKKYAKMASEAFMNNPVYVAACKSEKIRKLVIYHIILMRLYISRKTDIFYFDQEERGLLVLRKAGSDYTVGEVLKCPNRPALIMLLPYVLKVLGILARFDSKGLYDENKTYIISPVFVDKTHQRKGVAARLIKRSIEDMGTKGYKVGLDTREPDNVGYYEKLGFKLIDHQLYEKDKVSSYYMLHE